MVLLERHLSVVRCFDATFSFALRMNVKYLDRLLLQSHGRKLHDRWYVKAMDIITRDRLLLIESNGKDWCIQAFLALVLCFLRRVPFAQRSSVIHSENRCFESIWLDLETLPCLQLLRAVQRLDVSKDEGEWIDGQNSSTRMSFHTSFSRGAQEEDTWVSWSLEEWLGEKSRGTNHVLGSTVIRMKWSYIRR